MRFLLVAGNIQRQIRASGLRIKIVERSRNGQSNEQIAVEFGISTQTVNRHLKRFLEVDCRYPPNLSPADQDLMRQQELDTMDHYQRELAMSIASLSPPKTYAEEIEGIRVRATALLAVSKSNERKSAMCGLNAPKAEAPNITNNNLAVLNGGPADQIQYLKDVVRLKELMLAKNVGPARDI
jgi:Homeodomain-like domain